MTGMRKTGKRNWRELLPEYKDLIAFLQEVRIEIDSIVHSHEFSVRVVRACVVAEIDLLIEDKFTGAIKARECAYGALCQAKTQVDPEAFYEALCAYDLGDFACDLWVHFSHFREDERSVIYQIWHARKDFLPNLGDVFQVAFDWVLRVRTNGNLGLRFYYALKRPNGMYAAFGQSCMYDDKPIGHILSEAAMKKLKEIFRAYVRERNSGEGRRP